MKNDKTIKELEFYQINFFNWGKNDSKIKLFIEIFIFQRE